MKAFNTLTTLAIAGAFTLTSCELGDLAVNLSVNQTETIIIDIDQSTEPDGSAIYSKTEVFDLNEGEAKEYVDRLEKVDIKLIKIVFKNFTGNEESVMSGDVDFGGGNKIDIPNATLTSLNPGDIILELTEASHGNLFDYLESKAKNEKSFSYSVNAALSHVPATATIEVTVDAKVKAKAKE